MAITYRDNGRTLYSGTEAERLAYTIETSDTYEKNVFWLEPNGNEFRVIEGAWVQTKVAGSETVLISPSSTWSYGSWPADSYLEQSGTGVNDNDVLFTSGDLSSYNVHMIQASAGAVDVEVSLDGITYSPAAGIALQDMGATASTTFVLVTASTGVYMLRGKYKNIRLVQNGATAATAVLASGNL